MGFAGRHRGNLARLGLAAWVLGLALAAGTALAAAGQLDTTFSGDGKRTVSFGSGSTGDEAGGLAIQGNGRIVVVGRSDQGPGVGTNFAIARFLPNGGLDQSFAGDGKRSTSFGNGSAFDEADAVAIQRDGRIVVIGNSDQGPTTGTDFAIARFMPNGSLDQSFSGDGKRTVSLGNQIDEANGVAIQPNGRIVVVGNSFQSPNHDFAIVRLMPSGGLDQSFSGDGKRLTSFRSDGSEKAEAVAIQTNGRMVVAGFFEGPGGFAIARLNPGGSLDTSFSGNGKRTITFGAGNAECNGLALQPNGRIVVAGLSDQGATGNDLAIARMTPGGALDQGFSGDGKRTAVFGPFDDGAEGVAIQPNGRIVAAGSSDRNGMGALDFALARFLANGSLDQSFSGDGKRMIAFGAGTDEANGLALGTGLGSVGAGIGIGYVVAGFSDQGATTGRDFAVARLLP